jgi:FAD/FMN-containing dehydrogenase
VATAFDYARLADLEVAVRGGGHNPAGHCLVDGGLVIDLSRLRRVEVTAGACTAGAGGGATWLDFDTATQAHGLVAPGGVVGSTGVCGLTLGGGIGHLTAQLGLTCDSLVGAELVTPDGRRVRAGVDENPELLWALRGAGGNFGVATRLELALHPLERVVGGQLVFGPEGVRDGLRRFRDVVAGAPRDLSCQAVLSLDESLASVLVLVPCYTGPDADPKGLRDLRSGPGLVEDAVRAHSFLEQQRVVDSPFGENRHYWKGNFAMELPDDLIDVLLDRLASLGFRGAAFNISATATWQDTTLDEEYIAWARETAAAIEPWSLGGGYVNYMQADEPIERVRAAFGDEAFSRLQALKRRYDPANVLRRNQNIPPATETPSRS